MKDLNSHIIAIAGTIVALLLILWLLFALQISAPILEEEEGIVVAFGDADMGGGMPDAPQVDPVTQVEQIPAPPAPSRPSDNDLMVQEDEESLALAQQREQDAKRKAEEDLLIQKQKEAEAQAEAERIAKEKALAEQRAKEQEAIDKAKQLTASFGQSGTAEGANEDNAVEGSSSAKGNPSGVNYGTTNGIPWAMNGRTALKLPKPSNDFNQEGVVEVRIWVDKEGNVTNAMLGGATTISDPHTKQLALTAARQAKFTKGDVPQIGTIKYYFEYTISN